VRHSTQCKYNQQYPFVQAGRANMQNINWEGLQYCLAVIREGSISRAAKKLQVNHTTVSRRITALETELNVRIFDRSTAGWLLTPLGEAILPSAQNMEEEFFNLSRIALADQSELTGSLRVTAIEGLFHQILIGPLSEFSNRYPEIDLDIMSTVTTLDLAAHEADIAFRITNQPPPDLVGKKIGDLAFAVYSTHELLAKWKESPDDISCIAWHEIGAEMPSWIQNNFPNMRVRFRVNSLNLLMGMVKRGVGFAVLPCALGDLEPTLTRVFDTHAKESVGFWVLSHIDLRTTARIRIFRDFMIDAIMPLVPLMEGNLPNAWNCQPAKDYLAK